MKVFPKENRHIIFDLLEHKNIEAFKLVPEYYRHEVFQYLDNKNIEALRLIPDNDGEYSETKRERVFKYLYYKSVEAFKLIRKERRHCVFRYLDEKSLEAFELIESYYCNDYVFEYLDGNTLKDYLTRSNGWKYQIPKTPFTITEFKSVDVDDRLWKFLFLDKKISKLLNLYP